MHGVGSRLARRANVLLRLQVAGDLDDLVGGACVEGAPVVRRYDGDGSDPEPPAGAEDAHGDLAAVGHEQLDDHGLIMRSGGTGM
jgi:hypothetical protein